MTFLGFLGRLLTTSDERDGVEHRNSESSKAKN